MIKYSSLVLTRSTMQTVPILTPVYGLALTVLVASVRSWCGEAGCKLLKSTFYLALSELLTTHCCLDRMIGGGGRREEGRLQTANLSRIIEQFLGELSSRGSVSSQ